VIRIRTKKSGALFSAPDQFDQSFIFLF